MSRKLTAGLFVTLDGIHEAPETWTFDYFSPDFEAALYALMDRSDALLLGRRTYEIFAGSWPERDLEDPMAKHLNNVAKYVVSNTLETPEWNNTALLNGDAAEEVAKLKQEPGGEITMSGSASLVRTLLAAGLVDELNLFVYPLILGSGEQFLVGDGERHPLNLVDSATLPNGVLHLTYQSAE